MIKPQRHELTLARTHETENAGLRREANHAAVRWVVDLSMILFDGTRSQNGFDIFQRLSINTS